VDPEDAPDASVAPLAPGEKVPKLAPAGLLGIARVGIAPWLSLSELEEFELLELDEFDEELELEFELLLELLDPEEPDDSFDPEPEPPC